MNLKPPTMPFGIVACTFSDTFLEIAACMDHLWKDERQIPWRTSRGLNYENKFKLKRSIRQIFELVFSLWRLVLTSIMVVFSAADIFQIFLKIFSCIIWLFCFSKQRIYQVTIVTYRVIYNSFRSFLGGIFVAVITIHNWCIPKYFLSIASKSN